MLDAGWLLVDRAAPAAEEDDEREKREQEQQRVNGDAAHDRKSQQDYYQSENHG
jgi:hypothetical protein